MDSLSTILKLVVKDCYMASLDLKDAYYSVPIGDFTVTSAILFGGQTNSVAR